MKLEQILRVAKAVSVILVVTPLLIPVVTLRWILLFIVQLLEVVHLVIVRWVGIPLLDLTGLREKAPPSAPDHYHYHGVRDWLANKLGVARHDWRRIKEENP